MGLFGALFGKGGKGQLTFNLVGGLEDIARFVRERCSDKGWETKPTKEVWLPTFVAKKGTRTKDMIVPPSQFFLEINYNGNIASFGASTTDGKNVTFSVALKYLNGNTQKDVDNNLEIIKEALIEKFH